MVKCKYKKSQKAKSEKSRSELSRELEEMSERLDEANAMTTGQGVFTQNR